MTSDFWTNFIFLIVILHFVAGFGYLIYKLSPRKEDREKQNLVDEITSED